MASDDHERGTVCVTGAAGFVGSWLVRNLLHRGYSVNATARDPGNINKVKHLLDLPHADTRLKLWKADLVDEGSFDGAIQGCIGVFHVATPTAFESKDTEDKVIKQAENGILNILRSCLKAKTVRRVVYTSSIAAVCAVRQERQPPVYDESSWSDLEFIRQEKMIPWYFMSKTLSEKGALEFAEQNSIDLVTIIPSLVVGKFLTPWMPPSMITALALITGYEAHYPLMMQVRLVHLDDLCNAHIYLFEHTKAKGRYICSSYHTNIIELAKWLRERFLEYHVPTEFNYEEESLKVVPFSSRKLTELGFEFKYSLEDMYLGAIESAREKGLIPLSNPTPLIDKSSKSEEAEKNQ
ncbi:dihydroflavonol 4-reductase-like isoform X2 [Macadamia integrifolia]|uniref:dihydroflavonol 4-reductase-like isoform X2 n=1 Tax=Macadamia integrifolia TaxID=60698 RepID=UPI001C4EAE1D|nr:dihydroflavonol 4-reductase-like isoform X2 [Macadamia integrifolia]